MAAAVWLAAGPLAAAELDKVRFGTNWVAQPEHGGFYQALADGAYRRYGLDVAIVPGGPHVNNRILLPVGRLDFFMSANTLQAFDAVAQNVPTLVVAALFQKDPQVLIAHPGVVSRFEDLKTLTLFISKEGMTSYFQWLKTEYGFSEARVKPYTFNPQPFLADKQSAMQGYVTSEPYSIEKQAGFKPVVFLLADYGFDSYSTLIETRRDLAENNPDLVQRFVDASIIGWYNYLYGDNAAANALIKKDNPEMSDALIAYSVDKMKAYGIVDSGDARTGGIGAMTDARMAGFFDKMARAGVVQSDARLPPRLLAALRQQGRRHRAAAEKVSGVRKRLSRQRVLRSVTALIGGRARSLADRCSGTSKHAPPATSRACCSISGQRINNSPAFSCSLSERRQPLARKNPRSPDERNTVRIARSRVMRRSPEITIQSSASRRKVGNPCLVPDTGPVLLAQGVGPMSVFPDEAVERRCKTWRKIFIDQDVHAASRRANAAACSTARTGTA